MRGGRRADGYSVNLNLLVFESVRERLISLAALAFDVLLATGTHRLDNSGDLELAIARRIIEMHSADAAQADNAKAY